MSEVMDQIDSSSGALSINAVPTLILLQLLENSFGFNQAIGKRERKRWAG